MSQLRFRVTRRSLRSLGTLREAVSHGLPFD